MSEVPGGVCYMWRSRGASNPANLTTATTTANTTCNYMQSTGGYSVVINAYTWLDPGAVHAQRVAAAGTAGLGAAMGRAVGRRGLFCIYCVGGRVGQGLGGPAAVHRQRRLQLPSASYQPTKLRTI